MKKKKYSYWWPVPPPKGFEGWAVEAELHNRWVLTQDGQVLAYLLRRCRNKTIRFQISLSPRYASRVAPPKGRLSLRLDLVKSGWLTAPALIAWWTTLHLTGEVS